MVGKFPPKKVSELLVQCHRRCCICHRYCGSKIETDHIKPAAEGGDSSIENAIPVCFECHAEIHSYNISHPRGRKFQPEELLGHKEQWLAICTEHPEIMVAASWNIDVGPLHALVDELEYNQTIARQEIARAEHLIGGALFHNDQFNRAISAGMISVLKPELKQSILGAYALMNQANELRIGGLRQDHRSRVETGATAIARKSLEDSSPAIDQAAEQLMEFLIE